MSDSSEEKASEGDVDHGLRAVYALFIVSHVMQPFVVMQAIRQGFMTEDAKAILQFPEQLSLDLTTWSGE